MRSIHTSRLFASGSRGLRKTMPTYEYACKSCGNAWEAVQRITENPLDTCPKCNEKTAQRQLSGGSFILKGGGWYSDLYSSSKGGGSSSGGDSGGSST
jgi:putative FmdB family regulatory protein